MTREMQIAAERAAQAAQSDPLVDALEACEVARLALIGRALDGETRSQSVQAGRAVRMLVHVIAKYAPDGGVI